MKIKIISFIVLANLFALILISAIINRTSFKKQFQGRFKKNSFMMCDSIIIETTSDSLFEFYVHHFPEYYVQTAKIHRQFELLNSDSISLGAKILCKEGSENQMVINNYVVNNIIPGKYLYWSSEPSVIEVKAKNGIRKSYCNTHVYLDFEDLGQNKTLHRITIVLQMPNYYYKII